MIRSIAAQLRSHIATESPLYRRCREWSAVFLTIGSGQAAVQGAGFLAGILIVRLLPPSEYALYTVAFAMQGTMNILADGGISAGSMAEGGKVWRDPAKLGAIIITSLDLRRRFAALTVLFAGPFLMYLLHSHGASWLVAAAVTVAVVVNFWLMLANAVYGIAPLLHQKISSTQAIGIYQNLGRLGALFALLPKVPSALVAIVVNACSQAWGTRRMKRLAGGIANMAVSKDPEVKSAILAVVKRMLPGVVYFSVSGQITVFLISIFGNTTKVAQVGALGRLAQVFTFLSLFASTVLIPRFARLQPVRRLILKRYIQVMSILAMVGIGIVGMVAAFPSEVLWILGRQYSGLTHEVVLLVLGSVFTLLAQITFGMGSARGYVIHPGLSITLEVLWQLTLVFLVDLHTVRGILWMSLGMAMFQFVMQATYVVRRIRLLPTGI